MVDASEKCEYQDLAAIISTFTQTVRVGLNDGDNRCWCNQLMDAGALCVDFDSE